MDVQKELQNEIQYLRWNIYTLAYALDDLTKQLSEHEEELKTIGFMIGKPKRRPPREEQLGISTATSVK